MNNVHFSSKRQTWETPQELFDKLNDEFHFTLDACATSETAKCERFLGPEDNALEKVWPGIVWLNPPYGRDIWKWVMRARANARIYGYPVVCLLPARCDTRWWHEHVMRANEVRFIKGRIKFVGANHAAPFPSCIVVFRPHVGRGRPKFSSWTFKEEENDTSRTFKLV